MMSSINAYRNELRANCTGGKGIPDIVRYVPDIFDTLEQLIRDPDLTNHERTLTFAALGYFFIPDDLFPEEELGQAGYIDDAILSLCIIKGITQEVQGRNAVLRHWKLEQDMEEVLGPQLSKLIQEHPEEYVGVLDHFGLLPENVDLD